MKEYRVFGDAVVTVSCVVSVREETVAGLSEDELRKLLCKRAEKKFGGIHGYLGNGGDDKLAGVENDRESIAADDVVMWTDFMEEL